MPSQQFVIRFKDPERPPETVLADEAWTIVDGEYVFYHTRPGGERHRIAFPTNEVYTPESNP